MKPIKMLGLAVLATLIATASLGNSSAMGETTALCKEDVVSVPGEVCPTGQLISHIHEVSAPKMILLSSLNLVLCDVLFLGDITSTGQLGNPLETLGNLTYSNCEDHDSRACTGTELSAHTLSSELKLGHELADYTYSGEWLVSCGAFFHCQYKSAGVVGHILGPLLTGEENGEVLFTEQTLTKTSGFLCPKTTKLDLRFTSLESIYMAK